MTDSNAAEPLLRIRDLEVSYGQTQVLFGVDLDVHEGEIVALLGTNGAGKSTVLRAVSSLTPASGGRVVLDGRDITKSAPAEIAGLGVAQVPGGRGVFPTLTVEENLRMAGWVRRRDRAGTSQATEQVLDLFPSLRERWGTVAGALSGGEQQMLSLGQAFLSEPRLLMIDELSLGLAPSIVDRLVAVVQQFLERGTTILIVEQSVHTALRLAQRAVFLEKGEVRFSGATADLLDRPEILRSVYLKGATAVGNGRSPDDAPQIREVRSGPPPSAEGGRPPALEAVGLTKRYGGVTAVDSVGFTLAAGEVLGIVGPNGAGKTTMFDLLSGLAPLDAGTVSLLGVDITKAAPHERAKLGLGRSFQDARLWSALTVEEAISLATQREVTPVATLATVFGMPSVSRSERAVKERVDDLIGLFGLSAFRDKFISELSTGSRRMVELACLVAVEPQVLLLDEPSSGIAQKEAEALGPVIRKVREFLDASVVIIEHDMPLLVGLADRLLALESGRYVVDGTADQVLTHPQVVASYLGQREQSRVKELN